jgi:hypothetical protein
MLEYGKESEERTMKPTGRRRGFKSWFVEPYRQVKLGLLFLILNLAFAGAIFGIFGYYIYDIFESLQVYFKLTNDQSSEILTKFQTPVLAGAILILLFVLISILVAVRYTHQIYGPLVSIHRFLDEYLEGATVTPLALRESDQLKELAEKLNLLVSLQPNEKRQPNLRPIYAYLDEILAGKMPAPIRARESDAFYGLIERLNKLAETLYTKKTS